MKARRRQGSGREADRIRIALGILGLVWGVGCAGLGGAPEWVDGEPPPEYPNAKFVSARGTGETLEAASASAKAELSRIFAAELDSQLELVDQETTQGGESESRSDLLVRTTISSDARLEGVEVPLHWRDRRTRQFWALAVLERNTECLRVRSESRDLITRLDGLAVEARSQANPLLAVRAGIQATGLARRLDGLEARSRVLGSACVVGRSVSTGEMLAETDARLRGLTFVVRAEDIDGRTGRSQGSLPQLRERIAGNLTRLGFQVGPSQGADVIPVEARLRLSRVARGTEWVEYRWEGSAEVGSARQGEPVLIAAESEGAESHPVDATARLRARRKGEQDLSRQLDTLLKAFLAEGAEG